MTKVAISIASEDEINELVRPVTKIDYGHMLVGSTPHDEKSIGAVLQDLIREKEDLDKKIAPIESIDVSNFPHNEKMLFRRQEEAMFEYSAVLKERIDNLGWHILLLNSEKNKIELLNKFDQILNSMESECSALTFSESDKFLLIQEALSGYEKYGSLTFQEELGRGIRRFCYKINKTARDHMKSI